MPSCAILEKVWKIFMANICQQECQIIPYWAKRLPAYITKCWDHWNGYVPFPLPLKNITLIVWRLSSCTIIVMLPVCFLLLSEKHLRSSIFSKWYTVDKKTTATMVREWEDFKSVIVFIISLFEHYSLIDLTVMTI